MTRNSGLYGHPYAAGGVKLLFGSAARHTGRLAALGALLAAPLGATLHAAAEGAPRGPREDFSRPALASNLHWNVDFALTYLERFGRPDGRVKLWPSQPALTPAATGQPRSLGLQKLRVALSWQAADNAAFDLVLRPDAVNRAGEADATPPVREFDSRSGDPYRPMPSMRLLDAYRLSLAAGDNLSCAIGVWEELAPVRASYRQILDFGLGVRLPAKFSALRVRWREQATGRDARSSAGEGFTGDVYVLQGDEDRVEQQGARSSQYDHGPVANDPYYGGATYLAWVKGPWELGLLAGLQDGAYNTGKRSETQAELVAVYQLTDAALPAKLAVDVRMTQEKWRGTTHKIKDRQQASVSLTTATSFAPDQWALLGAHWGSSDNEKSPTEQDALKTTSGYQFDLGLASRLGAGLTTTLMLTAEERTAKVAGEATRGGFVNAEGDRKSLRRMGIELRYLLDANS